jgi:hypothetical protein
MAFALMDTQTTGHQYIFESEHIIFIIRPKLGLLLSMTILPQLVHVLLLAPASIYCVPNHTIPGTLIEFPKVEAKDFGQTNP